MASADVAAIPLSVTDRDAFTKHDRIRHKSLDDSYDSQLYAEMVDSNGLNTP